MDVKQEQILYKTKGKLGVFGRAIAIDLEDSNLPHDKGIKPHMTVVFSMQRFTQKDIDELQALEKQFRKLQNLGDNDEYVYHIERWGGSSSKILGQLHDLCIYLRQHFTGDSQSERIPHVALKKPSRK